MDHGVNSTAAHLTTFTSSKRRRNTLTKKNPPSAYPPQTTLRKEQSFAALQRAPSAPSPYHRSHDTSHSARDLHHRSQSNAYGSSTSSLEHLSSAPSPIVPSSDFFTSAANGFQVPHHVPLTPQTSDDRHNDLIGAPFDASGLLSSFQSTGMSEKQDGGASSPNFAPLAHTHTSPDMRSQQLRTSQTFGPGGVALMEVTPPKSENGTLSPKRFSGDGQTKPAGPFRKKSGFSSFVNNMLGSPRTIKISAPENPMHMIHVGYDNQTGQFTVSSKCPGRWRPGDLRPAANAFLVGTTSRLAENPIREWHTQDRTGTKPSDDDEHRRNIQEQPGWKRGRGLAEV
jgi:p21-activated kinase 1